MRLLTFCLLLCYVAGSITTFEEFVTKFGKTYKTPEARAHARECFKHSLQRIAKLNSHHDGAHHGITQFADMCPDEWSRFLHGRLATRHNDDVPVAPLSNISAEAIPKAVDWRKKNAVTSVKQEGPCGMTWAFAAVASMEGQHAISTGQLISLSAQEIGDCDHNGVFCCHGGLMSRADEWVLKNGGIDSDADWPYHAGTTGCAKCNTTKAATKKVAKFADWTTIAQDEKEIQKWVALHGPVSVGLDARTAGWDSYKGGIMKNCKATQLDHAVALVGYDTTGPTPYWIAKNQWGTTWGVEGYIYLEMFTNQCGIKQKASTICNKKGCPIGA